MPETRFNITPVGIKYVCDECNKGEMVAVKDVGLLTYPIQYPHRCTVCDNTKNFFTTYPKIIWEEEPPVRFEVLP